MVVKNTKQLAKDIEERIQIKPQTLRLNHALNLFLNSLTQSLRSMLIFLKLLTHDYFSQALAWF